MHHSTPLAIPVLLSLLPGSSSIEPHNTPPQGVSPAIRFLGRELRTPLNVFLNTGEWRESNARDRQRRNYPGRRNIESKQFNKGQLVWVKKGSRNFKPAVIHEQQSATYYRVNIENRGTVAAHVDQLLPRVMREAVPAPSPAPATTPTTRLYNNTNGNGALNPTSITL